MLTPLLDSWIMNRNQDFHALSKSNGWFPVTAILGLGAPMGDLPGLAKIPACGQDHGHAAVGDFTGRYQFFLWLAKGYVSANSRFLSE